MSLLALVIRSKYISPAWTIFSALRPAVSRVSGTVSIAFPSPDRGCNTEATGRETVAATTPALRAAANRSVERFRCTALQCSSDPCVVKGGDS